MDTSEHITPITDCHILETGRISGGFRYVTVAYAVDQLAAYLSAKEFPTRLDIAACVYQWA